MTWLLAVWLGLSSAYAQGYRMLPDGTWLCASSWNPGSYDRPLRSYVSVHGEGGLGIASQTRPDATEKEKASPFEFGGGVTVMHTLGTPRLKLLAEGRFGQFRDVEATEPKLGLWSGHAAVLYGKSAVWTGYYKVVLKEDSVSWTTSDTTYTLTNQVYCDETSAKRSQEGYGVGVHVDGLTGVPAVTLEYMAARQVWRNGGHADIVQVFGMYGPKGGEHGAKIGVGLSGRRVYRRGMSFGWGLEWWGTPHEGRTKAGTGFLLTGQLGFGAINLI